MLFLTDHASLVNLESVQLDTIKNPRVLRLLENLMCIDFKVQHVSAKQNVVADYYCAQLTKSLVNFTPVSTFIFLASKLKVENLAEIRCLTS